MRHKLLWTFAIQTDHLISARRLDLMIVNKKKKKKKKERKKKKKKKKENLLNSGVRRSGKTEKKKKSEKTDKSLDRARKLKKLWNMKVTVIPIVNGSLGPATKGLVQGLEEMEIRRRMEIIQTSALVRSAPILRRVLKI